MVGISIAAAFLLLAQTMVAPSPSPSPAPPADAAAILQRVESAWTGLTAYQVPVTVSGHVRAAILSLPVHMSGIQYYAAPDKQILVLHNPPRLARGLGDSLTNMGSPPTWTRDYDLALTGSQPRQHHGAYILAGPPKKRDSRVKTMTVSISATTYAIESVAFAYNNGARLVITLQRHHGLTPYHLPRTLTLTAKFPAYSGDATITYGAYEVNPTLPDSLFTPHH
jgi:hypothetical protein